VLRRAESATIKDVARLAGVSSKTVSNVVNNFKHVSAGMRARVEAAIDELGYTVNVSARSLRKGRTGLIKLAVPELRNPYFAELADAIVQEATQRGLTVLLQQYQYDLGAELSVLRNNDPSLADGVLFSPVLVGQDHVELFNVDFPLVLLGETAFGTGCDHVTMRNVEGSRAQVEHLLALGRRHIGVLGLNEDYPHMSSATLRYQGVTQAMADAGVELDPDLVVGPGRWVRPVGAQLMRLVLERGKQLDAVVCFNDALALGAVSELLNQGVRVPDDIAVIGFDNVEDAAYTHPPLSSIDPGRPEIARVGVAMLCERMGLVDGFDNATAGRESFIDFELVARESTIGR
jgi:DNA-binding LacI/PurR family transcriptional regulator